METPKTDDVDLYMELLVDGQRFYFAYQSWLTYELWLANKAGDIESVKHLTTELDKYMKSENKFGTIN